MKTALSSLAILGLVSLLATSPVAAQQPNSLHASLLINNVTAPLQATVLAPGFSSARVSGTANVPYALFAGTFLQGGIFYPGAGLLNLRPDRPIFPIINGVMPSTVWDPSAVLNALGTSTLVAGLGNHAPGPWLAFQALVVDPTSLSGYRLSAATETNCVNSGLGNGSTLGTFGVGSGSSAGAWAEVETFVSAVGTSDITVFDTVNFQTDASTVFEGPNNSSLTLASIIPGSPIHIEGFTDAMGTLHATQIELENNLNQHKIGATVDATGTNSLTLLGLTVAVAPNAYIHQHEGSAIALSSIVAGDHVSVKGSYTTLAGFVATEVELEGVGNPGGTNPGGGNPGGGNPGGGNAPIGVEAPVDAASPSSVTIFGVTFNILPSTQFQNFTSAANLIPGQWASVEGVANAQGGYDATQIELSNPSLTISLQGPVDTIGASSFVMLGHTINVLPTTSFQSENGPFSFASITVGMSVEVEGTNSFGTVNATQVQPASSSTFGGTNPGGGNPGGGNPSGPTPPIGVEAPVDSASMNSVTIFGVTFNILPSTQFQNFASTANLIPGQWASVEGVANAQGGYDATQIELSNPSLTISLQGPVTSIGANSFMMLGHMINVLPTTSFQSENGPFSFASIMVGMSVEVEGTNSLGSINATQVQLASNSTFGGGSTPPPPSGNVQVQVKAPLDAVMAGSLTVYGVTFNVLPSTQFENFYALTSLNPGQWVSVEGLPDGQGGYNATQIELENPSNHISLEGPVTSIGASSFMMLGHMVNVLPSTSFQSENGPFSFASITLGMSVDVEGTNNQGTLNATQIELSN